MSTEELPRDDDPTASYPAVEAHSPAAPISVSSGDRCTNCHAPLAADQRYCVNCGERRGGPRFSSALLDPGAASPTAAEAASQREPGGPRFGSGATLVAFVATLLVAVGLGVLIGHDSSNTTPRTTTAAAAPNIIVNGGGAAGTSTSATSSSAGPSRSKGAKASRASTKASAPAKVVAKANSAANKVLGGGATKLAPSTVKQGGKCTGGAGCQGGKFTGNFFGQ
ncbi:MAG TPA: hypothetical protein VG223_06055 [Solirubrobacteraceae bacterium]|jgi:hypothetical protein|nr:hypothetical protein [Solirubrobacteraceae bacterium]